MTAARSEVITSTAALGTCPNCDAEVLRALVDWKGSGADPNDRIDVFVTCDGDLAELAEAGLDLGYVDGELVTGSIALADIATLAATAGVRWIAASARAFYWTPAISALPDPRAVGRPRLPRRDLGHSIDLWHLL
jgi:hypothetical protein